MIASRPWTSSVPATRQAPVARTFWQKPAGVHERLHERVGREVRAGVICPRGSREVAAVQPGHPGPGGPVGAQPVAGAIRPDRLAVGEPHVVVRRSGVLRMDGRDARPPGMPEQQLVGPDSLARGHPGPLFQAQAERLEAQLRVPHEGEEPIDVRLSGRQLGDLGRRAPWIDVVSAAAAQREVVDMRGILACRSRHAAGRRATRAGADPRRPLRTRGGRRAPGRLAGTMEPGNP